MSFSERVLITIETRVEGARQQLSGFKQSVTEAQGATGKLKAAASGVGSAVTGALGALTSPAGLAGVGTALVAVGTKAIGAFQDLGIAVGKFSDATGTTSEEASRLVEVFDDLGVSPDAAASSLARMSKTLATNEDALAKWGITAKKAADGTTDVNATFIAAVDTISKIKDPAQQAAAAQATFGKSWQQMAEVIQGGAPALKAALASVQDSKVFDDADVKKARDLRDALDSVKDAGEGLMITLGKSLAPAIIELAPKIADIGTKAEPIVKALGDSFVSAADGVGVLVDALGPLVGLVSKLGTIKLPSGEDFNWITAGGLQMGQKAWHGLTDDIKLAGAVTEDFGKKGKEAAEAAGSAAWDEAGAHLKAWGENLSAQFKAIDEANKALLEQADALNKVSDSYTNAADDQIAFTDAQEEFVKTSKDAKATTDDVRDAAIDAAKAHLQLYTSLTEASGAATTATGKLDAQNQSLLQNAATAKGPARDAIMEYVFALNGIKPEYRSDIIAALNKGDVEEANRLLNEASANRTAAINADANTAAANRELDDAARTRTVTFQAQVTGLAEMIRQQKAALQQAGATSVTGMSTAPSAVLLAPTVTPQAMASVNAMTANRTVKVTFEPAGLDGLLGAFLGAVKKGTSTMVRVNGGL